MHCSTIIDSDSILYIQSKYGLFKPLNIIRGCACWLSGWISYFCQLILWYSTVAGSIHEVVDQQSVWIIIKLICKNDSNHLIPYRYIFLMSNRALKYHESIIPNNQMDARNLDLYCWISSCFQDRQITKDRWYLIEISITKMIFSTDRSSPMIF